MANFFNSAKVKAKFDTPHAKKCMLSLKQFRTALLPIKLTWNNYRFKAKKVTFWNPLLLWMDWTHFYTPNYLHEKLIAETIYEQVIFSLTKEVCNQHPNKWIWTFKTLTTFFMFILLYFRSILKGINRLLAVCILMSACLNLIWRYHLFDKMLVKFCIYCRVRAHKLFGVVNNIF